MVKRDEEGLSLHAGGGRVGNPGSSGRAIGNGGGSVWDPVDQAGLQAVPQWADPLGSRGSLGGH